MTQRGKIPLTYDLSCYIGDDFSDTLTFTGNTVTGWTFASDIVDSAGNVIASFSFSKSGEVATRTIAKAVTATVTAGVYTYDLYITRSGVTKTYWKGKFEFKERNTA